MRRLGGFLHGFVTAVLLLALAGSTSAAQGLTVKGDAQAWKEIEAAFIKFSKAKSYRAKMIMKDGGTTTMETVPPDRMRTITTTGAETYEWITVGNQVRVRQGNGPWTCVPSAGPAPIPNTNPQQMAGEVTAARGPAVVIEGVQTQSYSYTWKDAVSTSNLKLYVAVNNGLPKRIESLDNKGAVEMTINYYDYDVPITINLPACG